jgi:hypothetical protein
MRRVQTGDTFLAPIAMYLGEPELGLSEHRRIVRPHHQLEESTMNQIEDRPTASAKDALSVGKSTQPQSLRLEKQTIRTLNGAELRLVGGGCTGGTCGPHTRWTF